MQDIEFLRLWDIYSPLLTQKQREISNLYYNCDLSLGEIAEEKGVSRQSVLICLQTCRKQIESYEEKLRLTATLNDYAKTQEILSAVKEYANTLHGEEKLILERLLQR